MATGLGVWIGSASAMYGGVTVATTGQILPCVYGTVASAFSPIIYSLAITAIKPQNFDWADFRKEKLAFGEAEGDATATDKVIQAELRDPHAENQPHLKRWAKIAAYWSIATFLGHWVLWPLPMYASKYVFGRTFFEAWLTVAIIWVWGSMLVAGFFPLIGGRRQFVSIYRVIRYGKKEQVVEVGGTPSSESTTSVEKKEANAQVAEAPLSARA